MIKKPMKGGRFGFVRSPEDRKRVAEFLRNERAEFRKTRSLMGSFGSEVAAQIDRAIVKVLGR